MAEWPERYRSRSKVIMCNTPSYASDHLCQISKESIQSVHTAVGQTRQHVPYLSMQFYCKVMAEWPWRYMSRSKVIMLDTPSDASDQLCLIWKESIQNYRSYRADTECGTDRRTDRRTDRWTEWNQYIPPTTSLCVGYNYVLNAHEDFDQYGSFAIPSKIMPCYSYPASWVNQNEIDLLC